MTQLCPPSARKNADWFEAHWDKMEPVTEAKRKALLDYKQNPCPSTHDALKAARSKAQQTARCCANEYWQTLCAKIQSAADCGYTRGMYEGIKAATGPTSVKTALLKSKAGETIIDQSQQLQRWVAHYPSFARRRISSQSLPSTPCPACQSWRSSITYPQKKSSAKSSTLWPAARHQGRTVFLQSS